MAEMKERPDVGLVRVGYDALETALRAASSADTNRKQALRALPESAFGRLNQAGLDQVSSDLSCCVPRLAT
jgi:hypothetical protein